MSLHLALQNNTSVFYTLSQRMEEGGSFFMYTLLIILSINSFLFFKFFFKKDQVQKGITLINSISLFALVFGFLGQIFGLIQVFDAIEFNGHIAPEVLASGIKITALSPAFGMFVFLTGRLSTILLITFKK